MSASGQDDAPPILPTPRPGHWVGVMLMGVFGAWVAYQVWVNPGFQWDVVGRYLLNPQVVRGVGMTLELTALVMLVGTAIGVVLAVMRLSDRKGAAVMRLWLHLVLSAERRCWCS